MRELLEGTESLESLRLSAEQKFIVQLLLAVRCFEIEEARDLRSMSIDEVVALVLGTDFPGKS